MERVFLFFQSKGALVLVALVALLLLERLFPVARAVGGLRRVARNLSFGGLNAVLSWAVVVPVSAVAAQWALDWRPLWWAGWPGLALDLLLLDGWIYWWHRANHRLPLLWRFHQVHHRDLFLDVTTQMRFHFGEVLLSAGVRAAVIVALAIPLESVIAFEILLQLGTAFHHSNLRVAPALERSMARVVVTPSIHWVHHHRRQADTDSNYATLFAWWDPLFRSRSPTPRTPAMPLGVEGQPERGFLALLAMPFKGV